MDLECLTAKLCII